MIKSINKESSNIAGWHYDTELRMLTIEFKNKTVYEYYSVPETLHDEAENAESIGKFFAAKVRGKFEYKKVR